MTIIRYEHNEPEMMHAECSDLVKYVLSQCVFVEYAQIEKIPCMEQWCESTFGEKRPGSILAEAMEGMLDYFDGDWSSFYHPREQGILFWFSSHARRAQFMLTWL
jgi:hypothetical protein